MMSVYMAGWTVPTLCTTQSTLDGIVYKRALSTLVLIVAILIHGKQRFLRLEPTAASLDLASVDS